MRMLLDAYIKNITNKLDGTVDKLDNILSDNSSMLNSLNGSMSKSDVRKFCTNNAYNVNDIRNCIANLLLELHNINIDFRTKADILQDKLDNMDEFAGAKDDAFYNEKYQNMLKDLKETLNKFNSNSDDVLNVLSENAGPINTAKRIKENKSRGKQVDPDEANERIRMYKEGYDIADIALRFNRTDNAIRIFLQNQKNADGTDVYIHGHNKRVNPKIK